MSDVNLRVSPKLLITELKKAFTSMLECRSVYIAFDKQNIGYNEIRYKGSNEPTKYVSLKPLDIQIQKRNEDIERVPEDWYKKHYPVQRIHITLTKTRQLQDPRINVLRIDPTIKTYKNNEYCDCWINKVPPELEQEYISKIAQKVEDAKPDFMMYLDQHPESIRFMRPNYIDRVRRAVNDIYDVEIDHDTAQKWIHQFRKEQPECSLCLMDKYSSSYEPKTNREYRSQADNYTFGTYIKNQTTS